MVVSDGMRVVEGVWLDVFFIDFLNRLARVREGMDLDKPVEKARELLIMRRKGLI